MVTRDIFGTVFGEGDILAFSLATGQIIPVKVSRVTSGLSGAPPACFVETELPLGIDANGVVHGVVVLKVAEKTNIIEGK